MALKPNTFTTQNTPFFIGFTPYTLPPNTVVADNVSDMVSYSFAVPSTETKLTYSVGAESTYLINMAVSNITENAIIDVEVIVDETIFKVVRLPKFTLNPKETKIPTINLNKASLNMLTPFEKQTSIKLQITNRTSGVQIIKNVNTPLVIPQEFPSTIDIT